MTKSHNKHIKSDKIFIKNKKGEILNLEDNPPNDYLTIELLKLIFDNFGSDGTRVFQINRTKSIVEYYENNATEETNKKRRIKSILSCGADGWGLIISSYN